MRLYAIAGKHGGWMSWWHYDPAECVPLISDARLAIRCARIYEGSVVEFVPATELEKLSAENTALRAELAKTRESFILNADNARHCPWCQDSAELYVKVEHNTDYDACVVCARCQVSGPLSVLSETEAEAKSSAIRLWNQRGG